MRSHPAKIVRADETDADAIIAILSAGFQNDPVSRWLFPADDARERLHPEFFRPIVQMTLEDGEIYTNEDRSGTALWLPVTAHHEDQPGLGELYEPILGADYANRIAAFDERSTANHPGHEDHLYLPFIAVRPQFFNQGIGTALLRDRLAALDSQGLPTYLEASNRDSARHPLAPGQEDCPGKERTGEHLPSPRQGPLTFTPVPAEGGPPRYETTREHPPRPEAGRG